MAKKSKLLAALDAHKGRDYKAEKRKAQVKAAEMRKRQKLAKTEHEDEDDEDAAEEENKENAAATTRTDDFADFDANEDAEDDEVDDKTTSTTIPQPTMPVDASASEADPDSDVPLSDLEESDLEDTVPYQRMTINNGPALLASRNRIAVVKDSQHLPFHTHNSLISSIPPASESIPDVHDDLTRELGFYRIARTAALEARSFLAKEKIPFTRPKDYFAEMVKTDEHMTRVKQKMYDEAAGKKASEEARKLRDAKKFGKQVQIAKEQERAKEKRNTLDKIKELKRKRKGTSNDKTTEGSLEDDLFQKVDVEAVAAKDSSGRERGPGFNPKRQKRDQKYGFGGRKRHSKSGDAASSSDMRGFSAARMKGRGGRGGGAARGGGKGKAPRLGKSKRAATR